MTLAIAQRIAQHFDAAAVTYDHAALVQQRVAQQLFDLCLPWWTEAAPRNFVEAGCGTGFLTQHLCHQFPDASLRALDIAPGMVALCQHRLAHHVQLQCEVGNAETLKLPAAVDCFISSLCLQWFGDWRASLAHWAKQAGMIAFSVPVQGSFAHWTAAHARAGQRDGLYPLPDAQELQQYCARMGTLLRFSLQSEHLHYDNALDFARALRAIGAHQPRHAHRPAALRRVLRELPHGIDAEYRVAYCILQTRATR